MGPEKITALSRKACCSLERGFVVFGGGGLEVCGEVVVDARREDLRF